MEGEKKPLDKTQNNVIKTLKSQIESLFDLLKQNRCRVYLTFKDESNKKSSKTFQTHNNATAIKKAILEHGQNIEEIKIKRGERDQVCNMTWSEICIDSKSISTDFYTKWKEGGISPISIVYNGEQESEEILTTIIANHDKDCKTYQKFKEEPSPIPDKYDWVNNRKDGSDGCLTM